jgi:hypothetical protein
MESIALDKDYVSVTEIAGDEVTQEQGERWEEQKLRGQMSEDRGRKSEGGEEEGRLEGERKRRGRKKSFG